MDPRAQLSHLPVAQQKAVIDVATRFRCWPDDIELRFEPFDLPAGYVEATIGIQKDRPFVFGVSSTGDVSS